MVHAILVEQFLNVLQCLSLYSEVAQFFLSFPFVSDQVGEARALYNIGNVFHAKGKQQLWGCTQDPGDLPPVVRDTLKRATSFYE